jgi:hypothetical protein
VRGIARIVIKETQTVAGEHISCHCLCFSEHDIGLSLKALLPAAAWYFIVKVYRFSPCGAKNDTQRIEDYRQAKALST